MDAIGERENAEGGNKGRGLGEGREGELSGARGHGHWLRRTAHPAWRAYLIARPHAFRAPMLRIGYSVLTGEPTFQIAFAPDWLGSLRPSVLIPGDILYPVRYKPSRSDGITTSGSGSLTN